MGPIKDELSKLSHVGLKILDVQQASWPWDFSQRKHGGWKGSDENLRNDSLFRNINPFTKLMKLKFPCLSFKALQNLVLTFQHMITLGSLRQLSEFILYHRLSATGKNFTYDNLTTTLWVRYQPYGNETNVEGWFNLPKIPWLGSERWILIQVLWAPKLIARITLQCCQPISHHLLLSQPVGLFLPLK